MIPVYNEIQLLNEERIFEKSELSINQYENGTNIWR